MKGKKSARQKSPRVPSTGKQAVTRLKKNILARALARKRLVRAGIALGGSAVLAGLALLILFLVAPIPVECHDLTPAEIRAFTAAAERYHANTGTRFKIIEARNAGKRGLFAAKGLAVFRLSEETRAEAARFGDVPARISGIAADSLTSSFVRPGADGSRWAHPLLTDHLELFWTDADNRSAPETVAGLTAMLKADARGGIYPLVMAGADDELLLDGIGQLVVALGGTESYDRLCELARTGATPASAAAELPAFARAAAVLTRWKADGLLHPNYLSLKEHDAGALLERGQSRYILQTLPMHRALSPDILASSASGRFLETIPASGRDPSGLSEPPVMTANIVAAAVPAKGRWTDESADFLAWLSSPDGQTIISAISGLAPATLAGTAPDIQSRAVRSWASSSVIIQGLSRDGFSGAANRASFAAALRDYLRFN